MSADPLQTLLSACRGALPERALFLNAALCPGLPAHIAVQQHFKPEAARLEAAGYAVTPTPPDGPFAAVLIAGSKNHAETREMIALALDRLTPGGMLACAAANDAGGRRLKADCLAACLEPEEFSAHKSRAVIARTDGQRMPEWLEAVRPRSVPGTALLGRPGLFGWDGVDAGSALLAASLPAFAPGGRGADFGCGTGFLAESVLAAGAAPVDFFALDADFRAVTLCRKNLAQHGGVLETRWADLSILQENLPPLDYIVMNPPFHAGRKSDPALGAAFIRTASAALRPGGVLWMVANAHLPYEAVLSGCFRHARIVKQEKGFKVIHAVK